jgi:hypothetical protein
MANLLNVSRSIVTVSGTIANEARLFAIFDELCDGRCVSMHIKYDRRSDSSKIILSPCRAFKEYTKGPDGEQLNYRTCFEVDKAVMANIAKRLGGDKNAFIGRVWMPFKKANTHENVVLPSLVERSNCVAFELLSNNTYRKRTVGSPARNKHMERAESFLIEYFAIQAEHCRLSKPAARILNELSMAIAEAVSEDEKAAI